MKKMFCLLAAGIAVTGFAVDWSGFKKAKTLEKEKRYDEAIAVYEKLADAAKSDKDDQQYMEWAISAAKQKKDDAAVKRLANRVKQPERRKFVLMSIQTPAEVIAGCKDTDFMTWPEDLRSDAYATRGDAYHVQKDFEKALADYDKCLSLPGGRQVIKKVASARRAGGICERKKDLKKAEEYYRKALAVTNADYGVRCEALYALSQMLIARKCGAEACQLFEPVARLQKMQGYWGLQLNSAYADALIAAGKKVEALKTLDRVKKLSSEKAKPAVQRRIDALSADML